MTTPNLKLFAVKTILTNYVIAPSAGEAVETLEAYDLNELNAHMEVDAEEASVIEGDQAGGPPWIHDSLPVRFAELTCQQWLDKLKAEQEGK